MNKFVDAWFGAVTSVVEPHDVRRIVLTHDDHDHTGNLEVAMAAFPNATVVASWWMTERLSGSIEIDPTRMRWIVSGETLGIGDRTLVFQRPPLFDSPTTRAVFDASSGLYWAGDLGAAPGADAPVYAPEPRPATWRRASSSPRAGSARGSRCSTNGPTRPRCPISPGMGIRTWAQTH